MSNTATTTEEHALQALRDSGLRLTQPRRCIIRALSRASEPLSPREVYQQLGEASCDQVTIYRCLGDLEQQGLVHRHEFGDGSTRYQLIAPDGGHSHYVVCRICQHRQPLDICPAPQLEASAAAHGFTGISHTLELFGVCPQCQQGSG
ncbi:zinc uptake regulation protein ZUR [Halorhodospira halochloris]|uniref:Ferric uptake regulation protein n=1 Tax=Halorhodospira halochloris TaxID=1052 RepID=A0A120N010_HALHR|nr:Fur family transcriptional regulator [Halorhodospira halochloris]MBK1652173.1 transcriptional repressor [Halorhodospira halochloris]BAU58408.1 zinc uptake regulation protein ZUR [Halorhodospira halochloris]